MGKARNLADLLADGAVGTNEIANNAITPAKLANGGLELGMKNRIINGACQVAQRGTTTFNTQGTFLYGAVDRFVSAVSGASTWAASISQADIGNGRRAQQIQFTSTGTGFLQTGQRIESRNTFDLAGGQATFSGVVFHNFGSSQSFTVRAMYPSATDTFGNGNEVLIAQTTLSVSSETETPFTLTFDVPTQGTRGLLVEVTSSVTAQTSKSVLTWNWQLEAGSVATPFERRPYGTELALCQRYYQVIRFTGSESTSANGAIPTQSTALMTEMRATPTIVESFLDGGGVSAITYAFGTTATTFAASYTVNTSAGWYRRANYSLSSEL